MFKSIILTMMLMLLTTVAEAETSKIILIPLDSRPPCKNFVVDAGRIANLEIITPNNQNLDYYTIPGETGQLRKWIADKIFEADAVIISIDQILHGGLIAARESEINDNDIEELKVFLTNLKEQAPSVPIYAISILPRMEPQASIENYYQRRALKYYSQLIGKYYAGQYVDDESLFELTNEIKPENMKKYFAHFNENLNLNFHLTELVNNGILESLTIGLDDSEEFSAQSLEIQSLKQYILKNNIDNSVLITHGADEIALTLIAEIVAKDYTPKIFVKYNKAEASNFIMPYMSTSVETVVAEKIKQLNGIIVNSPDEADFILFLSINDSDRDSREIRIKNADFILQLINKNQKVALVDLSANFDKNETLLPVLISRQIPVNSLVAYSGWNTASNSIGTAISQATLFTTSFRSDEQKPRNFLLKLYKDNLTFLNQRFIEDQFYLKDGIDTVNHALKRSGSYDTSFLDVGTEYEFASFVLKVVMSKRISDYKQTVAFNLPIRINTDNDSFKLRVKDLTAKMAFPWVRTFEIDLTCFLDLELQE